MKSIIGSITITIMLRKKYEQKVLALFTCQRCISRIDLLTVQVQVTINESIGLQLC